MWAVVAGLAMFTNMWLLSMAVVMGAVMIKDSSSDLKVFYFVAMLPMIPLNFFVLPFPGLNTLWELSGPRLLVLALLLPAFFVYVIRVSKGRDIFRMSDLYFLCFVVLVSLLSFRGGGLTVMLRVTLSNFVELIIPYFVISRFITSSRSIDWVFTAFLISASFLACASLIEVVRSWRFYAETLINLNLVYSPVAFVTYVRGGIVRASGGSMLQPLAFAYFSAMAFVVCFYMWKNRIVSRLMALPMMALLFVAMMATGSRGGLLVVIVGIFMVYYFKFSSGLRFMINLAAVVLVPLGVITIAAVGVSAIDTEGSFQYRVDLIANSMNAVKSNLLFGSADYLNNADLEQSRQGEGIIDIVNTYLAKALSSGVVGLFLYVMSYFAVIYSAYRKAPSLTADRKDILLTLVAMTLVFIGTCSEVSYIPWYAVVVLAMTRAYVDQPVFDRGHIPVAAGPQRPSQVS